jgi:hypothetical protein
MVQGSVELHVCVSRKIANYGKIADIPYIPYLNLIAILLLSCQSSCNRFQPLSLILIYGCIQFYIYILYL